MPGLATRPVSRPRSTVLKSSWPTAAFDLSGATYETLGIALRTANNNPAAAHNTFGMTDTQNHARASRQGNAWRSRVVVGIAGLVLVLGVAWLEHGPILRSLAAWWSVSDRLTHADAVVVLGGAIDVRPFAAAAIYKRGLAGTVFLSNDRMGRAARLGLVPSPMELSREILLKLGVPAAAIVPFGKELSSTREEAAAIHALAANGQVKSIIVPTELFGGRRVRWIFDRELAPAGIHVVVHAFPSGEYTLDDWWRHRRGWIDFNNEVLKYLYYRMRY